MYGWIIPISVEQKRIKGTNILLSRFFTAQYRTIQTQIKNNISEKLKEVMKKPAIISEDGKIDAEEYNCQSFNVLPWYFISIGSQNN